ncbi:MAG: ABC transporter substrate-binding protein [Acetobacteraceae bacterium]
MSFRISLLAAAFSVAGMTVAQAQDCTAKIGAMGPMSGGAAQWGLAMLGAAELAAAEVNAAGGVMLNGKKCKIVVVGYDSKYTADGAAAGANALASEGIKIIIGPVGSPEATGIKPVAARNGQLTWNAAYAKNALDPKYPLAFHVAPGPGTWSDAMVKHALKYFPQIKSVALIAPNDQGGTDIASVDAVAYRNNGIKATEEYYQRGTTNFAPIITRLLASNPDAVDTASSPPGDAGVIVKQLRLAGFKGPIGRLGGPGTEEILRVSGGIDVLKDFYWFETVAVTDQMREIDTIYKKLLGKDPVGGTALWGDLPAARMTLKAIINAGTVDDAQKVAAELRKLPVEDPNMGKGIWAGQKQYGINQELFFPFGAGVIKDGKNLGITRITPEG